jgi:DNA polymerase III alpha subunit
MKEMINLALKSEYSFKQTFGKMDKIIDYDNGTGVLGVADVNNTFAHTKLEMICKEKKLKPIYGVRLMVLMDPEARDRKVHGPEYIFIAKNVEGLQEIYALVKTCYDKFFYKAQIGISDVLAVSNNVYIIASNPLTLDRLDYIGLSPSTPKMMAEFDHPKIAINTNRYCRAEDKSTYQLMAGARRNGTGLNYLFNDQTYPQHILSTDEWFRMWGDESAIENTHIVAANCDVTIPRASMVKFDTPDTVMALSLDGAARKNIDLNSEPYKSRFEFEMNLIESKDYADYFLIVSDMIRKAKKKMLVGPARGSSAGSLVCYLMDITEVDPLKFNLLFERFIDINRSDLPDIDVDFPDNKRDKVIKDLVKKFKASNVCHLSTVSSLKAKSAVGEVSMSLSIPKWEADVVKAFLVERSGGDARSKMRALDTLQTTDVGKDFIDKYPAAKAIGDVEGHARHAGIHAAGIIVCNDEMTTFGGMNSREGSIQMDKKDAEYLNLLKIDVLGLRTLTVLMDCADQVGMKYDEFYTLPLDDDGAYKLFRDMRISGIFQFEGQSMQMLCKQMEVEHFDDIVALTALARPGPLHSGGAAKFIKRRTGEEAVEYISDNPAYVECTKDTFGVIIYQEQLMEICRICGSMNFEEVAAIRRGSSKTLGKEFFQKYFESFKKGALANGFSEDELTEIWENMVTFGSWGMNKSHTVSYGYISYWCAYMKHHYPLEFYVANLRHSKNLDSAIKLLRDAEQNEGIGYLPVDADESEIDWSVKNGKLCGGIKNIRGIGDKKAQFVLSTRNLGGSYPPAIVKALIDPVTDFDTLYPCRDLWGGFFKEPHKYGLQIRPHYIDEIGEEGGHFTIIGKVITKDLRDLNEYNEIMKRGGEVLQSNSKFLKLIIQDDTDQIFCKVSRYKFDSLDGQSLSEKLIEDKSWVIIKGEVRGGWRLIDVETIFCLDGFEM